MGAPSAEPAGGRTGSVPAPRRTDPISKETWRGMLAALAAGDAEALATIYDAASDRIFGLALWRTGSVEDASDVVQEVFLRLVEARSRVDRVEDPLSWLLGLAHHVAVDVTRRSKSRATVPLDDVPFLAAVERDEGHAIDAARASRLLGRLPAAQRDAIYLKHFGECTFAAIGRITGVPAFTAASRYRLGIGKLRRLLEGSR